MSNDLLRQENNNQECPEGCCVGTEILCLAIPCPINLVLLGIDLTLELPCLRLTSSQELTGEQVTELLGTLTSILQSLVTVVGTQVNTLNKTK